jgi:acyl-CoA reductase-like NAD-dependent aldehyde dehydrogenase
MEKTDARLGWEPAPSVVSFLSESHGLWIDGEVRPAKSHEPICVVNPADGTVLSVVGAGTHEDVDAAVGAAKDSFARGAWSGLSPEDREETLRRLSGLIDEHAEELAQLDCLDNGMSLALARSEVAGAASHLRYFAGWCSKIQGETISPHRGGPYVVFTAREPIGVIGAVTAWNFPLDNAIWKIGASLACGNSVVLKPSEETPLSALYLARLAAEAGIPPGVLNVVTGLGAVAGAALSSHRDIDKIAFTGSSATGREIVRASAGNLKRVTLELGGKSPSIVLGDADLERHVPSIVGAVMHNSGQVCSAGSRVFVQRSIVAEFLDGARNIAEQLRVGPGWTEESEVGPLVSSRQLGRVLGYMEQGSQAGARIVSGGTRRLGELESGYFVEPTIFADVRDEMSIATDEIFGPVMSVLAFDDLDEVVMRANSTAYGLAAGIWTQDVGLAHRLARVLRSGTVWINCYNRFDPAVPFGGYGQSGYGRELGEAALDEYTQRKSVWLDFS